MISYLAREPLSADVEEFFLIVYESTCAEELAVLPWTPEQKMAFLRMQPNAQSTDYRRNYPHPEFLLIENNPGIHTLGLYRSQ
jgi:hypothetical protein